MTKAQVLQTMGTNVYKTSNGTINNPYKTEILKEGENIYEVVFYYTDYKKSDNLITDDELTPIVFSDGVLIGYGWMFVDDNITKVKLDIR